MFDGMHYRAETIRRAMTNLFGFAAVRSLDDSQYFKDFWAWRS